MRAVYKNEQGATYSCPVEIHNGKWAMVTSEGLQPITFYFDDDVAGRLTFDHYRSEEPDSRLQLPPRLPGESSFRQLQRANVTRIEDERQNRLWARTEAQNAAADRDATAVAAAQELNSQILHAKKPNGRGVGVLVTQGMSATEIEAALRNKRFRD